MTSQGIRDLWAEVERLPSLSVLQVIRGNSGAWSLLIAVPWCRFAREVQNAKEFESLLATLDEYNAKPPSDDKQTAGQAPEQPLLF